MSDAEIDILSEIQGITRTELGRERALSPDDDLVRDLGLDSLERIQLAVAVEDRYQVALSQPDAAQARTIGELVRLVLDACARRAGGEAELR